MVSQGLVTLQTRISVLFLKGIVFGYFLCFLPFAHVAIALLAKCKACSGVTCLDVEFPPL